MIEPQITQTTVSEKKSPFKNWKFLTNTQKISLVYLLVFLISLPVFVTTLIGTKILLRSRAQVATPPTPPSPTSPPMTGSFEKAVLFNNSDVMNENPSNASYVYSHPTTALTHSPSMTIEGWFNYKKPASGNYIRVYNPLVYIKPQSIYDYGYLFKLSFEVQESNGDARPIFYALKANSYSSLNSNYLSVGANSSIQIHPSEWNHIAITSRSENNICYLDLFINGVLADSSSAYSNNCQISYQQAQELRIAKPEAGVGGIGGYYYDGMIDELRISNTVRYSSNFSLSYFPFQPDEKTLLLYHFDGNFNEVNATPTEKFGSPSFVQIVITPTPTITPTPVLGNTNPVITTKLLKPARVGRFYKTNITASDRDGDLMQVSINYLPDGLNQGQCTENKTLTGVMKTTCQISGTPRTAGVYTVRVNVTDTKGATTSKNLSLTVNR